MKNPEKKPLYDAVRGVAELANLYYIRQKETRGLGHAILAAESFVGDEPFAILYGDDIIWSDGRPVIGQLIDAFNEYGRCVCGVQTRTTEQVMKYCTLDVTPLTDRLYSVHRVIEKPAREQILSHFSILGRNVVTPDVFDLIRSTPPSPKTGEVYFSEAISALAERDRLLAVEFEGKRYDMGDKLGILQANVEIALKHPEIGEDFRAYLKALAETI